MVALKTVQPGDPVSASEWNIIAGALNDVGTQQLPNLSRSDRPYVENTSDTTVELFQAVGITAPMFDDDADQYADFMQLQSMLGRKPQTADFGSFAIAAEDIPAGGIGPIFRGPIVPARVNITDAWHTRCDVDNDSHMLKSIPHGSAQIIWRKASTGSDVRCILRLGPPQDVSLLGKVSTVGGINAGGSGTVVVWRGNAPTSAGYAITDVRLQWMHGGSKVSEDKEVEIKFFADEREWRIVGAECE